MSSMKVTSNLCSLLLPLRRGVMGFPAVSLTKALPGECSVSQQSAADMHTRRCSFSLLSSLGESWIVTFNPSSQGGGHEALCTTNTSDSLVV